MTRHRTSRASFVDILKNVAASAAQVAKGFFVTVIGGEQNFNSIITCFPDDWQKFLKVPTDENGNSADQYSDFTSGINSALSVFEDVINFLCQYKDLVTSKLGRRYMRYFHYKNKLYYVLNRSGRRFFGKIGDAFKKAGGAIAGAAQKVGGAISGAAQKAGNAIKDTAIKVADGVKGAFEKVTGAVREGATRVVNGVVSIAQKTKDGFVWVVNKIADAVLWVVNKIKSGFQKAKEFVQGLFNNPIVQQIIKTVTCLIGARAEIQAAVKSVIEFIKKVIARVKDVATIVAAGNVPAIIKIVIDIICNFSIFKDAALTIVDAVRSKSRNERLYRIGKAIALIAKGLTHRRRRAVMYRSIKYI